MADQEIQVVRYDTLLGCLAAYFDCDVDELKNLKGNWEWVDADGNYHSQPMKVALMTARFELKCWGWLQDKHVLHVWTDERATPKQLLTVIGHEVGHSVRPYHREELREERKAAQYARATIRAFEIMNELIRARCGQA